jgi:hypothetical protein
VPVCRLSPIACRLIGKKELLEQHPSGLAQEEEPPVRRIGERTGDGQRPVAEPARPQPAQRVIDLRALITRIELAHHRARLYSIGTSVGNHQLELKKAPLAGHVPADGHAAVHEPRARVEPLLWERMA